MDNRCVYLIDTLGEIPRKRNAPPQQSPLRHSRTPGNIAPDKRGFKNDFRIMTQSIPGDPLSAGESHIEGQHNFWSWSSCTCLRSADAPSCRLSSYSRDPSLKRNVRTLQNICHMHTLFSKIIIMELDASQLDNTHHTAAASHCRSPLLQPETLPGASHSSHPWDGNRSRT